jgi:hypothetical protein
MKKAYLALLLVATVLFTEARPTNIITYWNGERYHTTYPENWTECGIFWNPEESEIPLSAREAHQIAKEWMKENFPSERYSIYGLQLANRSIGKEKGTWAWMVMIKNGVLFEKGKRKDGATMMEEESFDLFIRMDRAVLGPKKAPNTKE